MTEEKPDRTNPDRTVTQLRYYWGAVLPDLLKGIRKLYTSQGDSVDECPIEDTDALHSAMKYKFLGARMGLPGGEFLAVIPRTPRGRKEVSEFVDHVILYAAEHGIPIRLAHEPLEDE